MPKPTERELLLAAAKAAHIDLRGADWGGGRDGFYWVTNDGADIIKYWNPIHDDGDALRLAVKLNLHIGIDAVSAGAITIEWDFDEGGSSRRCIEQDAPLDGDDYAATRLAIVRAAASMAGV